MASAAHQPDDQHADQRRDDAGDAQRSVRHFQNGRHGALGAAGNAARQIPSIAKNRPSAARKSDIDARRYRGSRPPMLATLFAAPAARASAVGAPAWPSALRLAVHRCALHGGLPDRIAEIAEEVRIRPQHQAGVAVLQAPFIGLHGAVEGEEIRILAIGVGEDAVALGVALAADLLGLRGWPRR